MKITYLANNNILFDGKKGKLRNKNDPFFDVVYNFCGIDVSQYDSVYFLESDMIGGLLLVKGNKYRFFECGSGLPTEKTGTLEQGWDYWFSLFF